MKSHIGSKKYKIGLIHIYWPEATVVQYNTSYPLVVHWDGKILPKIFGQEKVDHFPILVSGDGNDKLLSVPALAAGTGEQEAVAVYSQLKLWRLSENVVAMSLDTTAENTGRLKGVCTLLELKLGRELLWLDCITISWNSFSKVFAFCCGPLSAPEIPIFKRFKAV